jgi:hypothetical protein
MSSSYVPVLACLPHAWRGLDDCIFDAAVQEAVALHALLLHMLLYGQLAASRICGLQTNAVPASTGFVHVTMPGRDFTGLQGHPASCAIKQKVNGWPCSQWCTCM